MSTTCYWRTKRHTMSNYRKIEQTIHITEQKSERLPVTVDGEITIADATIAVNDVDAKSDDVHQLTSDLEAAIESVLEAHAEVDDA